MHDAEALAAEEHSYRIVADQGKIVACAGIHEFWPGYGLSWAFVSDTVKPYMTSLVLLVRRFLQISPFHRIEAAVDVNFKDGHRFIRALGFEKECVMRKYSSDKRDHVLYSIVKED